MESSGQVVVNAEAKTNDSERRRIAVTLSKFASGSQERRVLDGYFAHLMARLKAGSTTLCSIRLALSPAGALLCLAKKSERLPPDQDVLNAYLATTPGQRAAVSGFVRYLREAHGAKVTLPRADLHKAHQQRRKKLEAALLTMMRERNVSSESRRKWLSVALAYFHGLSPSVGLVLKDADVLPSDDGMVVTWKSLLYWVPNSPQRHSDISKTSAEAR